MFKEISRGNSLTNLKDSFYTLRNNFRKLRFLLRKQSFFCFFLFLFIFSRSFIFPDNFQEEDQDLKRGYIIDYYGVISNDLDLNMSTMVSDLYYTQLSEIPNFTVYDKRIFPKNAEPSYVDKAGATNPIFYTKIIKNQEEETWSLNYIVIDSNKQQQFSKKKNYDSFYKILMESKNELESSVKDLIAQGNSEVNTGTSIVFPETFQYDNENISFTDNNSENNDSKDSDGNLTSGKKLNIKSLEILSGTWKGEESVDKIVILRGGRGFIIFKNGASMNISISIEENNGEQIISVKQKGNSNASFYPELPRKIALDAAVSAPPMEWAMILMDNMTMEGTKTTLIQDNESFKVSQVPVSWKKIN